MVDFASDEDLDAYSAPVVSAVERVGAAVVGIEAWRRVDGREVPAGRGLSFVFIPDRLLAIKVASQLIHRGRVRRGRLGIACAPSRLTRRQVRHVRLAQTGAVRVTEVDAEAPGA